MAKTETQKSAEAYRKTRKDYLQKRVSETQESLRTSGLSDKRKKKLQEQLKTFKDNLTKIKEQSSLKETKMAKQSLKDQYRKATTAGTTETKVITTAAPARKAPSPGSSKAPTNKHSPASRRPSKAPATKKPAARKAPSPNSTNTGSDESKLKALEEALDTARDQGAPKHEVSKLVSRIKVLKDSIRNAKNGDADSSAKEPAKSKPAGGGDPYAPTGDGKVHHSRGDESTVYSAKNFDPKALKPLTSLIDSLRKGSKVALKKLKEFVSVDDILYLADPNVSKEDALDGLIESDESVVRYANDSSSRPINLNNSSYPDSDILKTIKHLKGIKGEGESRKFRDSASEAMEYKDPDTVERKLNAAMRSTPSSTSTTPSKASDKEKEGNVKELKHHEREYIKSIELIKRMASRTRGGTEYLKRDPEYKRLMKELKEVRTKLSDIGESTGSRKTTPPSTNKPDAKPAAKPKSNPSSTVDLPNAKMRELNNRLIESRGKLSGLSNSTTNRTKIKALKDSIFWDELDLLGHYEKLTPARQKALDITKVIPADNIAKILKADKDNEFEKLKTSHPELLKAPRKDAPPKKVTKPTTSKPTAARDNVADIKKYALNLVNTKEENKKTSLRNTIAEIYGSLTASERKKLNLGTYVSKVDLKKMSSNNTAVKKYMDSPTAFLQSAAEVRHAFAKDKKMAESNGRKPIAPKATQALDKKKDDKPNTDANGKRYTKRGVTQMLKQLREQQESGRKTSNAYKQREEDIKRLTKVLKTLSSANPNISLSDKHRITVIANSLEVVTANTVWGTGATYDELAKALKKIGIKGVTADGLEGDFDEGDGVTSGSEPVYKYFDKILGDDDSEELAGADGAFVFATLYIAGLLGEDELKTVVPNANIRKLILKCGKKTEVSAARQSIKNTGLAKIAKLVFGVDTKPKASGNILYVDLSDVDGAEDYDLEDVRDSIIQIARTHLRLTLVGANGTDDGVVAVGERGGDAGVYLSVKGNEDEVAISFNQDELTLSI